MRKIKKIVEKLRSPEGCPWDRKQTHESLCDYLIEETWEVIDEIKSGRTGATLREELGDLLLQIVLQSQIAEEDHRFTLEDVVDSISEKMVNRHPHVFKTGSPELSDKQLRKQWNELKQEEKSGKQSIADKVLPSAPSLLNALIISKKAAGMGFDWETPWDVLLKVEEELHEISQEMEEGNVEGIEEEIGDLLFTVTNLARFYNINPEIALKKGNDKFLNRFERIEQAIDHAREEGRTLSHEEMEEHWINSKNHSK